MDWLRFALSSHLNREKNCAFIILFLILQLVPCCVDSFDNFQQWYSFGSVFILFHVLDSFSSSFFVSMACALSFALRMGYVFFSLLRLFFEIKVVMPAIPDACS